MSHIGLSSRPDGPPETDRSKADQELARLVDQTASRDLGWPPNRSDPKYSEPRMHLTMVKKQLLDGSPCRKCAQAEQFLRDRGVWERVDEIVWAIEGEPNSPGMRLAEEYGISLAPFFIVKDEGGTQVFDSAPRLLKERLSGVPAEKPTSLHAQAVAASPPTDAELLSADANLRSRAPQEILEFGLRHFGASCAIAFSGAEDVVLIDMASKLKLPFSVFCLDTGRLHPETYRFLERVRRHYNITIQMLFPNFVAVEDLVKRRGFTSFYEDGHQECCQIRKVEPLNRALRSFGAWATGQRRDQNPSTRGELAVVSRDALHEGAGGPIVKLNPLAHWSLGQVWQYIREHEVPYNELHDQGFVSVGCEPCTRAIRPGEHERAGRWWWEEATQRECGLHVSKN
ncbi:MAG: phosphoadenylyl-sulfate reductase [Polyangiaceae bacterium]|nr:phosphoadenylyl-sulfate reductase [Polyangiaceae bacterium]